MADVVMPQMGESIAEGTIVRWMKKVGDRVERDEPLFEISTDKVDAEIPAPAAGVVAEIRAKEGETVPVNSIVAVISSSQPAGATIAKPPDAQPTSAPPSVPTAGTGPQQPSGVIVEAAPPAVMERPRPMATPRDEVRPQREPSAGNVEELIRQRSSPLVRKIAKEHNIDISHIRGSGIAGRVTKDDILTFVGGLRSEAAAAPAKQAALPAAMPPSGPVAGTVAPMSVMRKRIAEHMIMSRRTSAHVHSVFEVNFGRVAQIRQAKKAEYEAAGAKLTFLSFILKAAVDALRAVPVVNASVDGENIVYHKEINVGIAVALDNGLIVPVIRNADEKNLLGLTRGLSDIASRARSKQLKPDEVSGGTFTITNPGVFGALFGMPIINQPQVAILGVGYVEKRPVVVDDAIAIKPMGYLVLGYDHRIIDGAVADQFMSHVKKTLENWDADA